MSKERGMLRQFKAKVVTVEDDKLVVSVTPQIESMDEFTPSGRMLVDSNQLAFIYILDSDEGYHYVVFQKETWEQLNDMLQNDVSVYLKGKGDILLELKEFQSELTYLLSNIKDNPNYGEQMNREVEKTFI